MKERRLVLKMCQICPHTTKFLSVLSTAKNIDLEELKEGRMREETGQTKQKKEEKKRSVHTDTDKR